MRKIFITIASFLMSFVMCLGFLGGCGLISVDGEKDMNQVIATVKISDSLEKEEKILKKDIVMAYLNYGYMYEYNYGYTRDKVINMIVDSLISNRVFVQYAMQKFNADGLVVDNTVEDVWNIDRYLTNGTVDVEDNEILDAKYSAYKDMNNLITSYMDVEDKVQDAMPEAVRTVPTGAANAEKELTAAEKNAYVQKGIDDGDDNLERKKAFNKVIDLLDNNELLGDYTDDLTQTTYYQETLKNYKEQKLLEKFEKGIKDAARANVNFSDLEEVYASRYESQSDMSAADFAEKLSSATASDPVLVNKNGTYGYVYNLLLGASETLTTKLSDWETKYKKEHPQASKAELTAAKAEYREGIFNDIIAKDMRYSWIWSGYDGTLDGTTFTFTGDYTFAKDEVNSLPFKGEVKLLNPVEGEEPEDYVAEYSVTKLNKYSLSDFVEMMETYLYGSAQTDVKKSSASKAYYKIVNATGVNEYDAKINELLFAFSTDNGSLNTYKGYSITPTPDAGKSETYMQEFADAGRILLGMESDSTVCDQTLGNNSYIMVATDYGYHIMFYSEKFDSTYDYDNLTDYLNAFCTKTEATWADEFAAMLADFDDFEDKEHFLYTLLDSVSSTRVNKALANTQNDILGEYVYGDNKCVVKYESRYADLLKA